MPGTSTTTDLIRSARQVIRRPMRLRSSRRRRSCRALVGLSARADLVVIGRHAKHPGPQGPGSVRHAVLSHALGPVVVVPIIMTAPS